MAALWSMIISAAPSPPVAPPVAPSPPGAGYVRPYKMTFASADPVGAAQFAEKYLGAVSTPQPHKGGDGRCALIKWVYFPNSADGEPYQWHFVKGYHRPNGTMTVDAFEDRMARLHGDLGAKDAQYDAFEDFHVTMETSDLDHFATRFVADGVPVLARRNTGRPASFSLFFELPHVVCGSNARPNASAAPRGWLRLSCARAINCAGAVRWGSRLLVLRLSYAVARVHAGTQSSSSSLARRSAWSRRRRGHAAARRRVPIALSARQRARVPS